MTSLSTDQLIKWVKQYPLLYDPEHREYRISSVRDRIWQKIATATNEDANELKRRWKNLKDSYRKYLVANIDGATKKNYYRYWIWAKQMDYFKPYLPQIRNPNSYSPNRNYNKATTATDTEMPVIEYDSCDASPTFETKLEVNQSPEFVDTETHEYEIAIKEENPVEETITRTDNSRARSPSPVDGCSGYVDKRQTLCLTPMETIFLGYAQTVGRFSLKRQATTKMKIAQLIMEQELLEIEEADVDQFVVNVD